MKTDLKATIKATGETILVYRLSNVNYYDSNAMGANIPPSAPKANKKEFKPEEITII